MKIRLIACYNLENALCKTIGDIVKLIDVHESFVFTSDKIIFNSDDNKIDVQAQINCSVVEPANEVVFTIGLNLDEKFSDFRGLSLMREQLDKMLNRVDPESCQIILTRDDVASYFGTKSYPLIQEVENGMRDVVARFLLTNIGSSYFKTHNHKDLINKKIKESISSKKYDPVYNLDFIDIIGLLTKKFATIDENKVETIIKDSLLEDSNKIKELENFVKRSNYERFFFDIINENENKIIKSWNDLYRLRNSVAHNRGLSVSQYRTVTILHNYFMEIVSKLEKAVDEIKLTEKDIWLVTKYGALISANTIFGKEYIQLIESLTQRQRSQLAEGNEELHMIFGGKNTISDIIEGRINLIEWFPESKRVSFPDDFDGDFDYNNLDDLIENINESVVREVQSDLPLNVLKETSGLDYSQDIIEELVTNKSDFLIKMGWTKYI